MPDQLSQKYHSAVDQTRQDLSRSRHLPGDFYTSKDIEKLERENIFQKEWLCVAREEEFEEYGDYRAIDIAGEPIVLCRAKDGLLRAFYNVCRLRGTAVVEGSGGRKRLKGLPRKTLV